MNFLEKCTQIYQWFTGRKTITTVVVLGTCATLQAMGLITLPYWIYLALGTLSVVFFKMALNRLETQYWED